MGNSILPQTSGNPALERNRRFRLLSIRSLCVFTVILLAQFWILPSYLFLQSENELNLSSYRLKQLDAGLQKCAEFNAPPPQYTTSDVLARANPRWNSKTGQNATLVLRNVTLFDGDEILKNSVDVAFNKGIITSITSTGSSRSTGDAEVVDLAGKWVTPGLVDMHSHHLVMTWPELRATEDTNEVNDAFGPLTPFVRSLDSMKPYDEATTLIRSGGVTTSLILPGSANIIGGEAFIVKNVLRAGKDGEESVDELLLDHEVPKSERRRYMKMACGENPRRVYKHTRMGNAWIFRKHFERAVELKTRQDGWCLAAAVAREKQDASMIAALTTSTENQKGGLPEELELESSVAVLRGKVGVNIHCYEPEDFEDMILHSKEFGFRIQAFHHALSAWKVPELIKASGDNITIATFSDFSLYKQEAYGASLYAGKILAEHNVPVAYKSDHSEEGTNAKYLLYQAASGHSFGLSEIKALQSVTSVPAKSLQQNHRIGYAKPGYDADLVVWDSHPLSIGATPLQVYVDGKPTLDPAKVKVSMPKAKNVEYATTQLSRIRPTQSDEYKEKACKSVAQDHRKIIITGITTSLLSDFAHDSSTLGNITAVIDGGKIVCLGLHEQCVSTDSTDPIFHVSNGYLLPGLTAVSSSLGLREIAGESSTGDGAINKKSAVDNPDNLVYAKYGIHLEGRGFDRARIGGVTRAITTPLAQGGFSGGVSVGIKTGADGTILNGGIFEPDVALHFTVGEDAKSSEATPSISLAISTLRKILRDNEDKNNIFTRAANGSIPLVVHADNKYDILQLVKVKEDFSLIELVIFGGAEAPAVARELAAAQIPVILTHNRGGPTSFEDKDLLLGPPLTPSAAYVLSMANVTFGLAIQDVEGASSIHALALEASWAAKYAGLSAHEAIELVSTNIHTMLGLEISNPDIVVWEGNPLEFGASVALSIDGQDGKMTSCWPVSQ